jgi:hypothetical protein
MARTFLKGRPHRSRSWDCLGRTSRLCGSPRCPFLLPSFFPSSFVFALLLTASTLLALTFLPITPLFLFALRHGLCGSGGRSGTLLLILLHLAFEGLFLPPRSACSAAAHSSNSRSAAPSSRSRSSISGRQLCSRRRKPSYH